MLNNVSQNTILQSQEPTDTLFIKTEFPPANYISNPLRGNETSFVSQSDDELFWRQGVPNVPFYHSMSSSSRSTVSIQEGSEIQMLPSDFQTIRLGDVPQLKHQPSPTTEVSSHINAFPEGDIDFESNQQLEIVRHIRSEEYFSSAPKTAGCRRIEHVNFIPEGLYSASDINDIPWTPREIEDGRRIVKVSRSQKGATITAHFLIIQKMPSIMPVMDSPDYIYVSFLRCEVGEERTLKYLITSVEVIQIIELLIGALKTDGSIRRKERGRIRSNLFSLWFKQKSDSLLSTCLPRHENLLQQISRYRICKPYEIMRDLRFLQWDNLILALRRALLFYGVVRNSAKPA